MKQYIVDAFADNVFEGNPAAVIILDKWLSDDLMLKITQENNLSETAFTLKDGEFYQLRWFTPGGEIDLCGHATLATSFVIMNYVETNAELIRFQTLSGCLEVKKENDYFTMTFPAYKLKKMEVTDQMEQVIGVRPIEAWIGRDLVCVLENETSVEEAMIDLEKSKALPGLLLHITAKGKQYDSVSRSFAPKLGVSEDPVCGSGHCHIAPLWSKYLNKSTLIARQASQRGGTLRCKVTEDKIELSGKAALFSIAELYLPTLN